ncbi:monovalent cation:proton antiporter-2 (CPA2) family protein [Membranicola marinus]|uniref:Monovalent cation:proton antiporter-2 (CPA2) family protein n=1 Tax=Membranihabitans marinus TaxID=1227546 RepID=A0A953LBF9_9BACT|nr:monovalent cation:proton antiporter-2 (CPA2) family protein [Membranihabitans marinus]MBY5956579.1 monovalent cation:proton antiporter-2 (CPA2) family protein [Membranihabitans marinus]
MSGSILFEAIVFLTGAIICVPIARRLGLSSVLGYLFAGIIIGPFLLGFVGQEGQDILHFAEFGVVMMLFLVGLDIDLRSFWRMRKAIFGMGGAQVIGSILLSYFILIWLGVEWRIALTISMAVALSSTAISLQSIKENGLFHTTGGKSSFSILLFQDIIVILMLGVLPLLSNIDPMQTQGSQNGTERHYLLENLPLWIQTIAILLSIISIVIAGRYLIVPMLRRVAKSGVRELLVAMALLIVFGISWLMELVGLSPALGAFLGGVVLATSEFKHELESTLDPFKALLLGLFFMAVGTSINFLVIGDNPLVVSGLVVGVIVIKAVILYVVGFIFRLKIDQRLLLAVGLAQIGEFAFVLLSFSFELYILTREQLDIMLAVTALTMTITPILGMINERLILPRVGTRESEVRPMDQIEKKHKIILLGFGHFGSTIGRFLRAHGVEATVLDHDSNRVDFLRKMGFEVYYGDGTRMDLLESAGIAAADIIILAIDDTDAKLELVRKLKTKYPNLKYMVRAKNTFDAYELRKLGVRHIYREYFGTSIKMAGDVLSDLGFDQEATQTQVDKFIKYDQESMARLADTVTNKKEYLFQVREEIALQEKLMAEDLNIGKSKIDAHRKTAESQAKS